MKQRLIFIVVLWVLFMLPSLAVFAQDPGNVDTLYVSRVNGRLPANTQHTTYVTAYHDETLGAFSIPIKFKNPQTDVKLDSARYHKDVLDSVDLKDFVINNDSGFVVAFAVWFDESFKGPFDTLFLLYFTTGPTWDPSIHNPLDTFTPPTGQGIPLDFTTTVPTSHVPHYDPPGNLDVGDDERPPSSGIPRSYGLNQNYPNPFNASTVIDFAMPRAGHVKLEIYNILGQKVKDLIDEKVTAGYKKVVWDGTNNTGKGVASGVYFYRLKVADEFTEIKKMTMLR